MFIIIISVENQLCCLMLGLSKRSSLSA